MTEIDEGLSELCERGWKLLFRLGSAGKDPQGNHKMQLRVGRWMVKSHNLILVIHKLASDGYPGPVILTVDGEGEIGVLDGPECDAALRYFRQATILDDLAEIPGD